LAWFSCNRNRLGRDEIEQARTIDLFMMFDPGHSLDERILAEQFRY
jgi:NAD+ kinase